MADRRTRKKAKSAPSRQAMVDAMRDSAIKQFGEQHVVSGDDFFRMTGVPVRDNIPLQYLLGVDILPFERCWSIVGSWGSWKSALGWYMVKLFCEAGGIVAFLDTEHKTNSDQVQSILQGDFMHSGQILKHTITNLDEMLRKLVFLSNHYISSIPDGSIPFMLLVDSLGGVVSEEAVKDMMKDGQVDVGFAPAQNANRITQQFKGFVPNYLYAHNISLVTINHQKEKIDSARASFMPAAKSEAGGVHKDFANTWVLQLSNAGDKSTKSHSCVNVRMSTKKSSLSKVGKFITVPIYTFEEDVERDLPMRTQFDWDAALVDLLTREKTTFTKEKLDAICNVRASGTKAWCSDLGVPAKEPVSFAELGKLIHSKPDIVEKLQNLLGIKRKTSFGDDFEEDLVDTVTETE